MYNNPQVKIKLIRYPEETRVIKSLMDIIEHNFGFNFIVAEGHVVEIQMISTGIVIIPRQLRYLSKLYKLQVPSNKLKKLRNLEGCNSLSVINLHDNQLTDQALSPLFQIHNLTSLDLSQNLISSMIFLKDLINLESLNLANNKISEIPLLPPISLKHLDLSGNPIKKLENLQNFPNLLTLKIDSEMLSQEEQEILHNSMDDIRKYCQNNAT